MHISFKNTTTQHLQLITMDRIFNRYQQGSFLRLWNKSDVLHLAAEINPVRLSFPSLYTASVAAIETGDPVIVGYFLAMIRKCAVRIAMLLLQNPSPDSLPQWADLLRSFIIATCPMREVSDIDFDELTALLEVWMDERRAADLQAAEREASLVPILDEEGALRAEMYNARIVRRFFRTCIAALTPVFHHHLSLTQFYKVSQGFRNRGIQRGANIAVPIVVRTRMFIPTVDEYQSTGDRIALTAFCQPAKTVLAGTTCAVCVSDFELGAEKSVVTACKHYFHEACLDQWVNDSAMATGNTCPSCRMELCEGRPREPVPITTVATTEDISSTNESVLGFEDGRRFIEESLVNSDYPRVATQVRAG
jgi:hypothetical protein